MTDTAVRPLTGFGAEAALGSPADLDFVRSVCDEVDGLLHACLSGRLPATPKVCEALRRTLAELAGVAVPYGDVALTMRRDRALLLLADMMARISGQVTGAVPVIRADMPPPVDVPRTGDLAGPWAGAADPAPAAAVTTSPESVRGGSHRSPRRGRRRSGARRWVKLVAAVAVLAGGGAGAWLATGHHAPAAATGGVPAGGWTVVGDVELTNSTFVGTAQGQPCSGENAAGFTDVVPGAPVTLTDASGAVVGTGQLEPGIMAPGGVCRMEFSVAGVADRPAYRISVAGRGGVAYSRADLDADGWSPQITLGS